LSSESASEGQQSSKDTGNEEEAVLFSDEDEEFSKVKFKKQGGQFKLMEIQVPPNMIKAQGANRLRWDLMIIVLAVY
jgi:hypothetical protein